MTSQRISQLLDVDGTDPNAVADGAVLAGISSGDAEHPDLSTHDAMGLATDAELTAHADGVDPHPVYATDTDLSSHTHAAAYEPIGTVATHEAAADPHTGYLKESDFQQLDFLVGTATGLTANEIAVGTTPGGELGGTWASPTVDASHSGSTHAATQAAAEATAASGLSVHAAASDPHTGYRLESADHTHASSGLQAGTIDHGALTGMSDDDHPQYALDTDLTTHAGAADPHTGYRLESADHTHASTGLQGGVISTAGPDADVTVDAAGAAGTAGTQSRSAHGHKLATSASSAAAIGTAAAGTSGTAPSRGDHVHPTGAGTPSTQAIGDAAATGSGPAASMTDHKHAMPAFGTSPAAVGTQANGSSANIARIDHVHATGAGTPSTQAFGDAAATGSGPAAAMTDHKHAMPADPTTAHVAASDPHTQYTLDVERNAYYTDEASITMATTGTWTQPDRLTLSSTNRLTAAGTARMTIANTTKPVSGLMGSYTPGPFTLAQDDYLLQFRRMNLNGTTRVTLGSNAQVILSDLLSAAMTGQLVLAGKGR